MVVIITDPGSGKKYKLEPLDNGLCFQLFVSQEVGKTNKQGKLIKNKWKALGIYPHNLPHGLSLIVDCMLNDPANNDKIVEIKKLTSAAKTIDKHIDELKEALVATVMVKMIEEGADE